MTTAPAPGRHRAKPAFDRLVVWCVLVALVVYGVGGTLVELVGVRHVHAGASTLVAKVDPMAGWVDERRVVVTRIAPAHDESVPHEHAVATAHEHAHATLQRHHHAVGDPSVITLDTGLQAGSDDGSAPVGVGLQVMAFAGDAAFAPLSVERPRWAATVALAVAPWQPERLDRPPRV